MSARLGESVMKVVPRRIILPQYPSLNAALR